MFDLTLLKKYDLKGDLHHQLHNYGLSLSTTAVLAEYYLENRTQEEIENIGHAITRIYYACSDAFDDETRHELGIKPIHLDPEVDGYLNHLQNERASHPKLLDALYDHISLGDFSNIEDLTWTECFATLTFLNIASALETDRQEPSDNNYKSLSRHTMRTFASHVSDANESIIYARLYSEQPLKPKALQQKISQAISSRNKSAAAQRHEPANKIKARFIVYVRNHNDLSKRQAAREFYRQLNDTEQRILCPSLREENALRTLTDYYRNTITKQSVKTGQTYE